MHIFLHKAFPGLLQVIIPTAWYFGLLARNRKTQEKVPFGLHLKIRKDSQIVGKMAQKCYSGQVCCFGYFSYCLTEAEAHMYLICFLFRAGGSKSTLQQSSGVSILDLLISATAIEDASKLPDLSIFNLKQDSVRVLMCPPIKKKHDLSGPVLRDTARLSQRYPLLRAMGCLVSQHDQSGAIPRPLLSLFPAWRAFEVEVRYPPPPTKGVA